MKITNLNASPRLQNSTSQLILSQIKKYALTFIEQNENKNEFEWNDITLTNELPVDTDILVVAFPLYVDGIPSQLIMWLEKLLHEVKTLPTKYNHNIHVYGFVNCGFYEGKQTQWSLCQLEQFCDEVGFVYGGGMGLGTGPMINSMINLPDEIPIKKPVVDGMKQLALAIIEGNKLKDNIITQYNYPWTLYKIQAEAGWKQSAKKNNLKIKDLAKQVDYYN